MNIRFIRTLLFALVVLCMSAASFAQIGVAIRIGPPPLPVYEQSLFQTWLYLDTGLLASTMTTAIITGCRAHGMPPEVSFLWTPAYWLGRRRICFL